MARLARVLVLGQPQYVAQGKRHGNIGIVFSEFKAKAKEHCK